MGREKNHQETKRSDQLFEITKYHKRHDFQAVAEPSFQLELDAQLANELKRSWS